MKKFIVGLFAALLMSTGLVAVTSTAATAARCSYEGCLDTVTKGTASVVHKSRSRAKTKTTVQARVRAVDSNKRPVGKVKFTVKRKGTARVLVTQFRTLSRGNTTFETARLNKGRYQFALQYKRASDGGFSNSVGTGKFTVRR